jgi:hypothetical protein
VQLHSLLLQLQGQAWPSGPAKGRGRRWSGRQPAAQRGPGLVDLQLLLPQRSWRVCLVAGGLLRQGPEAALQLLQPPAGLLEAAAGLADLQVGGAGSR